MPQSFHNILNLQQELAPLSEAEALRWLSGRFSDKIIFSTSFSYEDQVITDLLANNKVPVTIFTLDTGRLFPETYNVWSRTNDQYGIKVQPFYPIAADIETFVAQNGPNAFYESVALRKACCHIRKVEPLQRALKGYDVWVTGLRAEHSPARQHLEQLEWDEANNILKFHPLLYWDFEKVEAYIHKNSVPYNVLHTQGFVSIGCAPCTRAIKPGEDFRAGRWWWEDASRKECGLHETGARNPVITNNVVN